MRFDERAFSARTNEDCAEVIAKHVNAQCIANFGRQISGCRPSTAARDEHCAICQVRIRPLCRSEIFSTWTRPHRLRYESCRREEVIWPSPLAQPCSSFTTYGVRRAFRPSSETRLVPSTQTRGRSGFWTKIRRLLCRCGVPGRMESDSWASIVSP